MIDHLNRKLLCSVLLVLGFAPLNATEHQSVSFISANYQHCAGYCEAQNIDCDKTSKKQGSYQWCKKNCLSPTKFDLHKYQEGIRSCHEDSENKSKG